MHREWLKTLFTSSYTVCMFNYNTLIDRLENGTFPNSLINNVENIAQTDNNTDDPFIVREEPWRLKYS